MQPDAIVQPVLDGVDEARRFGSLQRLYGHVGYAAIRRARVVVVGIGGVGSWAAEGLARSGVGHLALIDLDHIAESNINRQVHADSRTLGAAKVAVMAQRVLDIHPGCAVSPIDAFVEPDNWPALLPWQPDAVIDACDQMAAKEAMAAWALQTPGVAFITCGAAGGKRAAHLTDIADLSAVSHDPLLARLRQRLRKFHGAAPAGRTMGITAVYSREPMLGAATEAACDTQTQGGPSGLNCQGYGSSVAVTASFGFSALSWVLAKLTHLSAV